MITLTFLVVLLLLGHTQSSTITFVSNMAANKAFTTVIDPAFEVKTAQFNGSSNPLALCKATSKTAESSTECYKQDMSSTVHFLIADTTDLKEVQLKVGEVVKQTISKTDLENCGDKVTGGTTAKLERTNCPLACIPTAMVLIPNTQAQDGVKQNAEQELSVATGCPAQTPAEGCIELLTSAYPVTVQANMEEEARVLTLDGGKGEKVEATFIPYSVAAWMSNPAALILANLAIVYLAY